MVEASNFEDYLTSNKMYEWERSHVLQRFCVSDLLKKRFLFHNLKFFTSIAAIFSAKLF